MSKQKHPVADFDFCHHLINRLAVIVGQCDLIIEDLPEDSRGRQRLHLVQNLANSLAEEIKSRQRDLTPRTLAG